MSKTYLAGPMSGKKDFNRAEFVAAAERLRSWGHDVHSPVESNLDTYGTWEEAIKRPWQEHLARDISAVTACDTIALMRGWEESTGAQLELHVALAFKLNVISAEDGLELPYTEYAGMTYRTESPTDAQTAISRGEPVGPEAIRDYPPRGVGPATPLGLCTADYSGTPHARECPFFHGDLPPDLLDSLAAEDAARNQAELGRRAFVDTIETNRAEIQRRFFEHQDEGTSQFEFYEANPLRQTQVTGGMKDDKGKSRLDLIPTAPLVAVGHVLAFGARKYKPNNWRLGLKWSDTLASALRHLAAWNDGERIDAETGLSHLDHALCQLMFLSEYEKKGTGINDAWDPTKTEAA